jgi:hypothetical protein
MTPRLERAAQRATVLGFFVAAVTFFFGVRQFTDTQEMARKNIELQMETLQKDREIKATDLFLKFNEQKEKRGARP